MEWDVAGLRKARLRPLWERASFISNGRGRDQPVEVEERAKAKLEWDSGVKLQGGSMTLGIAMRYCRISKCSQKEIEYILIVTVL